ncbi:MAG TPA: VIT domain-containing protein, partial [Candidatus Hydrogenedentes bacterium]|nr:VIT domain-containing protein [Candidatus Hydrogenedentota bacterium]
MSKKQGQGFAVVAAASGKKVRLAMQELWLTGTVLPLGARLVVRHTFQSQEKKPLEAVYAFALPRDAAMRRFRIVGEGFNVESALKPLEEARHAYEDGLEEGHLAALAQQYADGLVNLNLGNIRPNETVTVYIEIAAGVACTDNGFRFRFPFTLAPGYHAQAAYGATEEGEGEITLPEEIFGDVILPRWRQDARELHRVGFDLNVAAGNDTVEIASPSHPVSVQVRSGAPARVTLATEADVPDRDLVLEAKYALTEPAVFAGWDTAGKGRFAAIVPSTCFGPVPDTPKRVVFLIDHSGSMSGKPFEQAKRATLACIAALQPEDRFGIVFFESGTTVFPAGCNAADQEQRNAARAFVNSMETAGGTELSAGIHEAATLLPEGGDILLLTDGQVYETETIITRARKAGVRVHCLGIGSASQDRFLALLARKTGGASHFATPRERVDEAALRLFNAIGAPAAEEVSCEIAGMKQAVFAPDLPKLVRVNEPLLIFGSCTGPDNGNLQLSWKGGSRTIHIPFPVMQEQQASPAPDVSSASGTHVPLGETLKLVQGARITTDLESL